MTNFINESAIEDVALGWFSSIGYTILHGPEIAAGELFAEPQSYQKAMLFHCLQYVLLPKLLSGESRVK